MGNTDKYFSTEQHAGARIPVNEEPCQCSPHPQDVADELRLYIDGDELYDAMLESMSRACQRIQLDSYIFADDEVGRRFIAVGSGSTVSYSILFCCYR